MRSKLGREPEGRVRRPTAAPGEGTAGARSGANDGPTASVATLAPIVKLVPVRDLVVVRPERPKGLTSSLIEVVDMTPKAAFRGIVLAVGPEVRDLQVGMRVLFSRLQGWQIELGETVFILPEGAILATE